MTLFRRIAAIQRPWLAMLLLMALMAGTYSWSLGSAPPYLSIEEVVAARTSVILAQTGADQLGRRLPLFVGEPGYPAGYDPLWVYTNAALLRVAPFSEALIRLPSIVAALASTALLFVAARHGIGGARVAWGSAAALALTPVFFIYSRIGSQPVATIPFVTLWLACLALHLRTGRRRLERRMLR